MSALPGSDRDAQRRTGLLAGVGAYMIWGLLPLYLRLLDGVSSYETVAHRVVWSVLFLCVVMAGMRLYPAFFAVFRQPRILAALGVSAMLIAGNWLIYVIAIDTGHIVACSLGYFLNPLVNVVLAQLVLKERLSRWQGIAIALAAIGVAILAAGEWRTLWISLGLALTFAFYGLIRKLTPVPSTVGLAVETVLLAGPALALLGWFAAAGTLGFGSNSLNTAVLIGTGALTSIPLLLFAVAARALPFVTLGTMQYLSPSLQFLIGVFVFGEFVSPERWASFMLIWAALALFVWDGLRTMRRVPVPAGA